MLLRASTTSYNVNIIAPISTVDRKVVRFLRGAGTAASHQYKMWREGQNRPVPIHL